MFVPKYRKRAIFGTLRKAIGKMLRQLCEQEGVELIEGHPMADHVHLCLSIPPKYSAAKSVGFLNSRSTIRIHREFMGRECNFMGYHFWARVYYVSTVGSDEQTIRESICNQEEEEERRQVQLPLGGLQPTSSPKEGL